MTNSYQNSVPGQISSERTAVQLAEPTSWETIQDQGDHSKRIGRLMLTVGVALLLFVVWVGSFHGTAATTLRGGDEVAVLQRYDASLDNIDNKNMPQPDYNGEGRYDWQKCQDSSDPECWKKEGERVGGYWHNFGLRMKTFWQNFRQSIHDFFAGPSAPANEQVEELTAETEKKHHKSDNNENVKDNATVTP
jgi:hypothetical protein